ncbi:MAG: DNA polymerase III subunit alpha [Phycisphaerae bacterium]|nr:DNA polymerase III subunit alpha [Phycisphaerae bacterium]
MQRLVQQAKEHGYAAVAVADVNAMYGAVDLFEWSRKLDIQPILGVEIVTDAQQAVLLAENRQGYQNLCRITTARNLDARFDLIRELQVHHEGVICIASCAPLLEAISQIMPRGNLFAPCVDGSGGRGVRPVAWGDFNVINDDDTAVAKLLSRIRNLSVAGAGPPDRGGFLKLPASEAFQASFRDDPQALAANEEIMHRCTFNLLDGRLFLPKADLPGGTSADKALAKLCHLGMARRYGVLKRDVVKRLEHELSVIRQNRFSDYFLVVNQIVNFTKSNGIPVDVRGSAAGAMVSYVLGFTRVCPIENNLYFERFMNPGRRDCPDIDVDLCWRRRDEVIQFCYEHWGYDRVAMISTLNRYRPRSAIRDVGRALGLGPVQINELVRRRHDDPGRSIYKLAEKLLDIPRHVGVHCGGIVIAPEPVAALCPLQMAAKGVIVTQYDKDAAEAAGLIKIDLLGNRSLSTVHETVTIIGRDTLDIDGIGGNDEKTAEMLSRGDSFGVFQCESPGMRQLLRGLKVRNRHDVAIALSLIRPGPAAGGMKTEYIDRHVYKKPFTYLHPKLKEVFGDTYGVLLYQEDVMRLAVEAAGYSVAEADRFRSEVSKKVSPARLQEQYIEFVYSRAQAAGIDRQTAETIWDNILRFAAYSYCKAHATVYANIAWQTAYLKAHFPQAFYASLFNNHHGMYPMRIYVWDAIRHGIRVLGPHVNRSGAEWATEGKAIRAGLGVVKGLSGSTMEGITQQRHIRPFADLNDLRERVRPTAPEIANLIHIGACDGLGGSRPAMLMQLQYLPPVRGQLTLFDLLPNPTIEQLPDYDRVARVKAEVDVSGIPFCMHPAILLHTRHVPANRLGRFINREVTVAGFIATARKARTSDGRTMGFVTLEDASGLAEVTFFPDEMEQYHRIVMESGPIWVRGRVTEHLSSISVEGRHWGAAA